MSDDDDFPVVVVKKPRFEDNKPRFEDNKPRFEDNKPRIDESNVVIESTVESKIIDMQTYVKSKNVSGDTSCTCRTLNVKQFVQVLTGLCEVPGVKYIHMELNPEGMSLYAAPPDSPSFVKVFLNKATFVNYNVPSSVRRLFDADRIDKCLKKRLKDIAVLTISVAKGFEGFTFSGKKQYKNGGDCDFEIHLQDLDEPGHGVIDHTSFSLPWTVTTSSEKFHDNVDFMDNANEFVQIIISKSSIIFNGVKSTGEISEKITQDVETNMLREDFSFILTKDYLKIVSSTSDINKSLRISFKMDDADSYLASPILFSYEIDQHFPPSHFSTYLCPKISLD